MHCQIYPLLYVLSLQGCLTLRSRGGFAIYRIALYHPGFVTHLFSICTPYAPPSKEYVPLETLVETRVPYFGYQLQFVSGELEKTIKSKRDIRQFLLSLYGGRTPSGEFGFNVFKGVLLDKFQHLQRSKVISEEVCASRPKFYVFYFRCCTVKSSECNILMLKLAELYITDNLMVGTKLLRR